jgi:hypothetical protein
VVCHLGSVSATLELKPHAGSDRAFTYFTPDWSEDPETGVVEQQNELFAFRFANAESECPVPTPRVDALLSLVSGCAGS